MDETPRYCVSSTISAPYEQLTRGERSENMQTIDTPCKKICTLHPQLQLCTGCGRTLAEIERWTALSPAERIGLIQVANERLATIEEVQAPPSAVGNS